MRERELKHVHLPLICSNIQSLPMRERELKPRHWATLPPSKPSLPMRERELKHHGLQSINYWRRRSPRGSDILCNQMILLCSPTQYEHPVRKHCG